ncbi:hypothetical protein M569_16674, partial [Genlisea aurea]
MRCGKDFSQGNIPATASDFSETGEDFLLAPALVSDFSFSPKLQCISATPQASQFLGCSTGYPLGREVEGPPPSEMPKDEDENPPSRAREVNTPTILRLRTGQGVKLSCPDPPRSGSAQGFSKNFSGLREETNPLPQPEGKVSRPVGPPVPHIVSGGVMNPRKACDGTLPPRAIFRSRRDPDPVWSPPVEAKEISPRGNREIGQEISEGLPPGITPEMFQRAKLSLELRKFLGYSADVPHLLSLDQVYEQLEEAQMAFRAQWLARAPPTIEELASQLPFLLRQGSNEEISPVHQPSLFGNFPAAQDRQLNFSTVPSPLSEFCVKNTPHPPGVNLLETSVFQESLGTQDEFLDEAVNCPPTLGPVSSMTPGRCGVMAPDRILPEAKRTPANIFPSKKIDENGGETSKFESQSPRVTLVESGIYGLNPSPTARGDPVERILPPQAQEFQEVAEFPTVGHRMDPHPLAAPGRCNLGTPDKRWLGAAKLHENAFSAEKDVEKSVGGGGKVMIPPQELAISTPPQCPTPMGHGPPLMHGRCGMGTPDEILLEATKLLENEILAGKKDDKLG